MLPPCWAQSEVEGACGLWSLLHAFWRLRDRHFQSHSTRNLCIVKFDVNEIVSLPSGFCVVDVGWRCSGAHFSAARPGVECASLHIHVYAINEGLNDESCVPVRKHSGRF